MLTNTKIQRFKIPSKIERHLDSNGLCIELTKSGGKNWRYRYKNDTGSWTMKALGFYPKVSLEKARALHSSHVLLLSWLKDLIELLLTSRRGRIKEKELSDIILIHF